MNFEQNIDNEDSKDQISEQELKKSKNWRKAGLLGLGLLRGMASFGNTGEDPEQMNNNFQDNVNPDAIEIRDSFKATPQIDNVETVYFEDLSEFEPEPIIEAEFEGDPNEFSFHTNVTFETDKASIANESQEVIKDAANKFFASITPDNFEQVMSGEWQLLGSSDERPTNAWGDRGNEALTEARLAKLFDTFDQSRDEFDFSPSGLTQDQIEQILTKPVALLMPEGGVTHILDMSNPETGENFTAEEVEDIRKNDKEKFSLLLQQARFVEFNVDADISNDVVENETSLSFEEVTPTFEITNHKDFVNKITQYDAVYMLLDNSESVSYDELVSAVQSSGNEQEFFAKVKTIIPFSDKVNMKTISHPENMDDLQNFLKTIENQGGGKELAVSSALEILSKMSANTSGSEQAIIVNTDEMIQDAQKIPELQEIAQEKGYEVLFAITDDETKKIAYLSSDNLKAVFDQQKGNLIPGQSLRVGFNGIVYGDGARDGSLQVIMEQKGMLDNLLASQ